VSTIDRPSQSPTPSPPRTLGRWTNDVPIRLVAVAVATVLIVFVLLPVVTLLREPAAADWLEFAGSSRLRTVAMNTAVMGLLSTTSATALGALFAYALTRPEILGRKVLRIAAILPLISPPFVVGLALLLLFGRRGIILHDLLGLDIDIFGLPALWIVQTVAFSPIAALAMAPVFRNVSASMEWAAWDQGYGWFGVLRRVTLPLCWPGLTAAYLLVALHVLADFGNPVLVGRGFRVLSVEAYMQAIGHHAFGMAAVVSTVLFVPTAGLFLIQRWIQKRRSFVTVSGREARSAGVPMPPTARRLMLAILAIPTVFIFTTYASIFYGAAVRSWGADWTPTLEHLSAALLRSDDVRNSVVYALTAALLTACFCVVAAYINHRTSLPGRRLLDGLAILPAAIPGTMLGLAWLITFHNPPLVLTGTAFILVMVMGVRTIPVGYRSTVSAMHQLAPTLDDAAMDLGYGRVRLFLRVIAPLVKGGFAVAFVFSFLNSLNTLSAVIFLVSPGRGLASPTIVNLAEFGEWSQATALAAILMLAGIVALCLAAVCIATTVVASRTRGMTLRRVPLFSWSMLVACALWLFTLFFIFSFFFRQRIRGRLWCCIRRRSAWSIYYAHSPYANLTGRACFWSRRRDRGRSGCRSWCWRRRRSGRRCRSRAGRRRKIPVRVVAGVNVRAIIGLNGSCVDVMRVPHVEMCNIPCSLRINTPLCTGNSGAKGKEASCHIFGCPGAKNSLKVIRLKRKSSSRRYLLAEIIKCGAAE
jgi:iron(III) transport system permease protein